MSSRKRIRYSEVPQELPSKVKRRHRVLDSSSEDSTPSTSTFSSSAKSVLDSSAGSASRNITYTLFEFDVNLKKETVTLPTDVAEALPEVVAYSQIKHYLPGKKKKGKLYFAHEKYVAIHCFECQEACSSCGKYSSRLRETMIDCRRTGGYVVLPTTSELKAAEIYDSGIEFESADIDVQHVTVDGKSKVQVTYEPLEVQRPRTPLSERERTENLINHLQSFFAKKQVPLSLTRGKKISFANFCRFSGGGDITVSANKGVVIIGGTATYDDDDEQITPLKKGDVATTGNLENKLATNPTCYEDTEKQLFANMHLSASHALIQGLLSGQINPTQIKRMISYGTILKPGCNLVVL